MYVCVCQIMDLIKNVSFIPYQIVILMSCLSMDVNFYIILCLPFHKKSVFFLEFRFFSLYSENHPILITKCRVRKFHKADFFHWRKRIINLSNYGILGFLYFFSSCNVKLCIHHSSLCFLLYFIYRFSLLRY